MSTPNIDVLRTAAGTVEVTARSGTTLAYRGSCDPDSEADRVRIIGEVLGVVPGLDPEKLDRAIRSCCRPTKVRSLAEVEALPPIRWLVDGLLPASSLSMLASQPNLGKTALACGWAMASATGSTWCGRSVLPGGVLIVSGEGLAGIGQRSRAWRTWAGAVVQQHPVEVADRLPPLSAPLGIAELRRIIDEFAIRHGARPVMVVIDTLAVHWAESEDKTEHVGPCLASLRTITDSGPSVLLLHHVRKPSGDRPAASGDAWASIRGSGAWVGGVDAALSLLGTRDALTLATTKQREAACAEDVQLALRAVEIGTADVPRSGVVVVAAEPDEVDAPRDVHEERVQQVLDVVRAMGGTAPSKVSVTSRMTGKSDLRRAAFAEALHRGLLIPHGPRGAVIYRLASVGPEPKGPAGASEGPGADDVCEYPPHPPLGVRGQGAGPAPAPAARRDARPDPREAADPVDDGMPEQPGGSRRRGGASKHRA